MTLSRALTLLALSSIPLALAQPPVQPGPGQPTIPQEQLALYEPEDGKVLFGAWIQTELGDTPALFNARLGLNTSVVQIEQQIPLIPYDWVTGAGGKGNEELIERTLTDAGVFLTVYPTNGGLSNVSQDDLVALGNQLLNYTDDFKRSVWLRWAPEMNGNWFNYGRQPSAYVALWQTMYTTIKGIAPKTAIVWAPNTGQGYPYNMGFPEDPNDVRLLDTQADGVFDTNDSPFSPYYPGDEYVDWVGLSVYWKGPRQENINVGNPVGYCAGALRNYNPNSGVDTADPWYQNYCAGRNKACMFAESGPAYHDMIDGDQGISDLDLKAAWWNDCLTNATFFREYPRMKMMMQFEYRKNESDSGINDSRDYRLTNKTDVLQGFQAALSSMAAQGETYVWATYRPEPVTTPGVVTQTNVVTTTDANGNVITTTSRLVTSTFSFFTVRNTNTGFPSLFGEYYESSAPAVLVSLAMFFSVTAAVLGGTVFLLRI